MRERDSESWEKGLWLRREAKSQRNSDSKNRTKQRRKKQSLKCFRWGGEKIKEKKKSRIYARDDDEPPTSRAIIDFVIKNVVNGWHYQQPLLEKKKRKKNYIYINSVLVGKWERKGGKKAIDLRLLLDSPYIIFLFFNFNFKPSQLPIYFPSIFGKI